MMVFEQATSDERQVIYRELVRALRELAPSLQHTEAREQLELLALRFQRLVEYREELSLLRSFPQYGARHSH